MSRNYGGDMVARMFVWFGADPTDFEKKMRASVTRMLFAAESLTQAGRIMTASVTGPILAIGAASIKTAMQFEASMTKMEALVGMPAETLARWKPAILEMSGIVGRSAKELGDALFFITSNGIRTDAALRVLEASAKASAVGMGETKDVAFAATSAMNAYGQGALTANEAVAVLIGTVREGNLEASTLPEAFGRLLPVAAAMGVEFHEAGAAIATMTRAGTSARLSAFGLRAILMSLLAPTKGARDAARELGTSFEELRTEAADKGLLEALLHMNAATEAQGQSLKRLFPSQRAYAAALQLLGENVDATTEIFGNMAEVVGEDVDAAFAKGAGTMQRTMDQALAKLSSAAVELGDNLVWVVDGFGDLADSAAGAAHSFNQMSDATKTLILAGVTTVAAIGPLLYALGSLARVTARFTGLSILFKAAWIQKVASMAMGTTAATALSAKMSVLGVTTGQLAGGILTAAIAGYQFGKWLDDMVGITDAINEEFGRFGDSVTSVGEALEKDGKRMANYTNASHRLAMAIGEVNLANELMDARMAGDAKRVAEITKKIEEQANAYNKVRIKVDGVTEAEEERNRKQEALQDQQEQWAKDEQERIDKLAKSMNLMTGPEVTQAMHGLAADYQDMLDKGIARNLVNKEMVDDTEELLRLAKEYNLELPEAFESMAGSMKETLKEATEEWDDLFERRLPEHIDAMPGKIIPAMIKVGDTVKDSLKGGLNRGFAEGLDDYTTNVKPQIEQSLQATWEGGFVGFGDDLRDQVLATVAWIQLQDWYIPVKPDPKTFNDAMNDLVDGAYPDTRG